MQPWYISMRVDIHAVPIRKKVTNKPSKIIFQCLYFQFGVKLLNEFYITRCLVSFLIRKLFQLINQGLNQETIALIKFYHKRIIFTNHLMMVLNLEVFSLICRKHLIKSGTMVLYWNYKKVLKHFFNKYKTKICIKWAVFFIV